MGVKLNQNDWRKMTFFIKKLNRFSKPKNFLERMEAFLCCNVLLLDIHARGLK